MSRHRTLAVAVGRSGSQIATPKWVGLAPEKLAEGALVREAGGEKRRSRPVEFAFRARLLDAWGLEDGVVFFEMLAVFGLRIPTARAGADPRP